MAPTDSVETSDFDFPRDFSTELISIDGNVMKLRSNINTPEEMKIWIQRYGEVTRTRWVVARTIPMEKLVYKACFACQHSAVNKAGEKRSGLDLASPGKRGLKRRSKNLKCPSQIYCKIKKLNRGTKKNDPYLCQTPPLCAEITVTINHNHNISYELAGPDEQLHGFMEPNIEMTVDTSSVEEAEQNQAALINAIDDKLNAWKDAVQTMGMVLRQQQPSTTMLNLLDMNLAILQQVSSSPVLAERYLQAITENLKFDLDPEALGLHLQFHDTR